MLTTAATLRALVTWWIDHVHRGAGQAAWDAGFVVLGGLGLMSAGVLIARQWRRSHLAHV